MICVVTEARRRDPMAQVRESVNAGVDLVQIREPTLEAADLAALVRAAVATARGTATRIVVNDRLDVALACGADGVHLRADSMPARAVRTLAARPFLVGRSVHTAADAAACGADVDYLIAGTVFSTSSKPAARELLGIDGLRGIVAATRIPVLAIGGVTLDRLTEIADTGAAGIAAIGLFAGPIPIADVAACVRQRFEKFDRAKAGS